VRADLRTYEKWARGDPPRARQPRAEEAEAKVDGTRASETERERVSETKRD
jgi:hypothetical protein